MKQLSQTRRDLVSNLSTQLGSIAGVSAVVLGGSHARGRARPESDIDVGVFHSEAMPFAIQSVRRLAAALNDTRDPVVTDFYGWGPWVNGGAWLTIGGQRVDLIYRNTEQIERVINDAQSGRYEVDYAQQPPFGFFSATYLGELRVCVPLVDRDEIIVSLKRRAALYPEALRRAVVHDYPWAAEFGLAAFARKFAARSDTYGTVACLTRAVNELVLVLFALNRTYPVNDKTALEEITEFGLAPKDFTARVQDALGRKLSSADDLVAAVDGVAALMRETAVLAQDLYEPRFVLPQ